MTVAFGHTVTEGEQATAGDPQGPAVPARPGREPQARRDRKPHGRAMRRAGGHTAYVGKNGSGKTAAMVHDTLPTLDGIRWACTQEDHLHMQPDYVDPYTGALGAATSGIRRVLANFRIYDDRTGLPHPLAIELRAENGGWVQVLQAEHCDLLFDEITGIAGSRESMGMPVAVQNHLQKLRHVDVPMRWAGPKFERADTIVRGVTNLLVECKGYLPDTRSIRQRDEPSAWVPKRLFKWRTFDAQDFDAFTAANAAADREKGSKTVALRPLRADWTWGPGSRMFAAYDTHGSVYRIAEYLDGGRCAICGGTRRAQPCRCHA